MVDPGPAVDRGDGNARDPPRSPDPPRKCDRSDGCAWCGAESGARGVRPPRRPRHPCSPAPGAPLMGSIRLTRRIRAAAGVARSFRLSHIIRVNGTGELADEGVPGGSDAPWRRDRVTSRAGRELCALACVNMEAVPKEPSRSSERSLPRCRGSARQPAAQVPCETFVEARCVDPWRSASRLGVRSTRPCAWDVPRPGRGAVRHAAVATVPRHSKGEVFGSTRPAPDRRSPYRPAQAATSPARRRRRLGARPNGP